MSLLSFVWYVVSTCFFVLVPCLALQVKREFLKKVRNGLLQYRHAKIGMPMMLLFSGLGTA